MVRLTDLEQGSIFAEAPLPTSSSVPITTVVESVVDSSRFFVLRVEDGDSNGKRHAFIGLGFRERADSSNFTAGLDDWRRFLIKRSQAMEMKGGGDVEVAGFDPAGSSKYALDESEHITLNINEKIVSNQGTGLMSRVQVTSLTGHKWRSASGEASHSNTAHVSSTTDDDWGDFVTG